jgi:dTDP-glucose pyrophosphorylase
MHAIIVAAGRGTRMAHLTQGGAKEMLPYRGRPVIAHVIEEVVEAGAEPIVVTSPAKEDLNAFLNRTGVRTALQPAALGLAHAVMCSGLSEAVLVCMGDTVFRGPSPLRALGQEPGLAVAAERVPAERAHLYGNLVLLNPERQQFSEIREKPTGVTCPAWAVAGRYRLTEEVMRFLHTHRFPDDRETGLTEVLNPFLKQSPGSFVDIAPAHRIDLGDPAVYQAAKT